MLVSIAKLSIRNLWREFFYVIVNVLSLALAILCVTITMIFIIHEFCFDTHHQNSENIVRAINEFTVTGNSDSTALALSSVNLGPMMKREFPTQIASFVRFRPYSHTASTVEVQHEKQSIYWDRGDIYYSDQSVFSIFSHTYVFGEVEEALANPASVALSASMAKRYFGNANPIGETIVIGGGEYKITLVFADLPNTSSLRYHALLSNKFIASENLNSDTAIGLLGFPENYTYFLLGDGTSISSFDFLADEFTQRYLKNNSRYSTKIYAEPLLDIYLQSKAPGAAKSGNFLFIFYIAGAAILILLIASINFVTLCTAQYSRRVKETKIRKLIGISNSQLIFQFTAESIFLTAAAFLISCSIFEIVKDYSFLQYLFGGITFTLSISLVTALFIFSLLLGAVIGLVPAIYLARIDINSAGSSKQANSHEAGKIRQFLIGVQYTLAMLALISIYIIIAQLSYIDDKALGFSPENKLALRIIGYENVNSIPLFMNDLEKTNIILEGAVTTLMPGDQVDFQPSYAQSESGLFESTTFARIGIDESYIATLGMRLLEGENFDAAIIDNPRNSVIVNETALKKMAWQEPIGKIIRWQQNGRNEATVIGVVKDFHFQGLHHKIKPLFFYPQELGMDRLDSDQQRGLNRFIVLSLDHETTQKERLLIESLWKVHFGSLPFEPKGLSESLDKQYLTERNQSYLISIAAVLSILILGIGLYSLSAYAISLRQKEISIRRILGATLKQIVIFLAKPHFLSLILAGFISSLAAVFLMENWLSYFAFRVNISLAPFLVAIAAVATLVAIIIGSQAIKSSLRNPVISLCD